jgi:hypothetical protein
MFYETKDDLLKATASYFEASLANHEHCLWAVSDPISEADAKSALNFSIADFGNYFATGSIEISSNEQWDLTEDEFNPQRITGGGPRNYIKHWSVVIRVCASAAMHLGSKPITGKSFANTIKRSIAALQASK